MKYKRVFCLMGSIFTIFLLIGCGKSEENVLKNSNSSKVDRNYYITKLNNMRDEMSALENLYGGSEEDLKQVADTELKMWNNMLSEIYLILEENLDKDEFAIIKAEQESWIKYRDKEKGVSNECLYEIQNTKVLVKITRERCYQLVEKYIQ